MVRFFICLYSSLIFIETGGLMSMNASKKSRNCLLLSAFFFLRIILFLPENLFNIDFENLKSLLRADLAFIVSLIALSSFLFAKLIIELYAKNPKLLFFPCYLLCTDVFLFVSQDSLLKLLVTVLWLAFYLLLLKSFNRFFLLSLPVSFICIALMPSSVFSFFLLFLLIYIIVFPNDNIRKKILVFLGEAITGLCAYLLNLLLTRKSEKFEAFLLKYSDNQYLSMNKFILTVAVMTVPLYIAARVFFHHASALKIKNKKQSGLSDLSDLAILIFIAFLINCASVIILKSTMTAAVTGSIFTASVIALILNGNKQINGFLTTLNSLIDSRKKMIIILVLSAVYVFYLNLFRNNVFFGCTFYRFAVEYIN